MIGRIKNVNSRGYGFIETDRMVDFYFHHTQFDGNWKMLLSRYINGEVTNVVFDSDVTATDGPRALNVKLDNGESK